MIVALVRAGKRVGVTSNSHRVIKSVLRAVRRARATERPSHPAHRRRRTRTQSAPFEFSKDYAGIRARLERARARRRGRHELGLGDRAPASAAWTCWSSTRPDRCRSPTCSRFRAPRESLVLFGDPAQLDQPQKGSHPPGAEASALEHLLGDALTMPADRGVFLPETRRLCPPFATSPRACSTRAGSQPIPGLETAAHRRACGHSTAAGCASCPSHIAATPISPTKK